MIILCPRFKINIITKRYSSTNTVQQKSTEKSSVFKEITVDSTGEVHILTKTKVESLSDENKAL